MKSKEEIEKSANEFSKDYIKTTSNSILQSTFKLEVGYIKGYTQCQEDIGKELEALRAAIRKNTWYDIDGNAQVNLYGIDNNLLNK
jgi:hypothetical protein